MKTQDNVDLKKKLKIEFISPEFEELLLEGYNKYKDNCKIHKQKAAEKRKENSKKFGHNKKKL